MSKIVRDRFGERDEADTNDGSEEEEENDEC